MSDMDCMHVQTGLCMLHLPLQYLSDSSRIFQTPAELQQHEEHF